MVNSINSIINQLTGIISDLLYPTNRMVRNRDEARLAKVIRSGRINKPFKILDLVKKWESMNGDIRNSTALTEAFRDLAQAHPELIPNHAHLREILHQYKLAAELYAAENDLTNAARCYEAEGLYQKAEAIYLKLHDVEGVSRNAEARGDLEKALQYVVKPERRVNLLIKLNRFQKAWEAAEKLDSPAAFKVLISQKATEQLNKLLEQKDYIAALKLFELSGKTPEERDQILSQARKHYLKLIAEANSGDAIRDINRNRIQLEETAGNFAEAGRIAEEDLGDLDLAILLYEKANLFDRAIEMTIEQSEGLSDNNEVKIRLAGLQERGGNLMKAAGLYESASLYEKAYELYHGVGHNNKALDCYLKVQEPDRDKLIQLYLELGEYEKAIDLCLKTGEFAYLDRALEVARTYNLNKHVGYIQEKIEEYLSSHAELLETEYARAKAEVVSLYSTIIGIDFGTTNSAAAIYNIQDRKVEIVKTPQGQYYEPSYFGVDEHNHPIFGDSARLHHLVAPDCVIAGVKRILGERRNISIGGTQYRTEQVVAKILQRIKLNTESYLQAMVDDKFKNKMIQIHPQITKGMLTEFLGKQQTAIEITDVILSVPAYYNDNQKRATRDAAEIAGLRVRRLLHEPTAAAIAYGHQRAFSGTLAVIDLGGGTLDISVLEVGDGLYAVQTVGGDTKLGGSDIDNILYKEMVAEIKRKTGIEISKGTYPSETARLEDACEQIKIALSSIQEESRPLSYFLNQPEYILTLSRAELERLAQPVLERLKTAIQKTIGKKKITHYLLVGNASKMPAVQNVVKKAIAGTYLSGIDPGTAVVCGDALEGAILSGSLKESLLLDVVPYNMGISVLKQNVVNSPEEFSIIINKDTIIPTAKTSDYTTVKDNQTEVRIKIYQGESPIARENYFLGDFVLSGIAPAPAGVPKIDVTFDISSDCILTVSAKDRYTGNMQSIRIEDAVTMSPAEKLSLSRKFAETEQLNMLEAEIIKVRNEIDAQMNNFNEVYAAAGDTVKKFNELFASRIESTPSLFTADEAQTTEIQKMFLQKDQLLISIPVYRDRYSAIVNNIRTKDDSRKPDFNDAKIKLILAEWIESLKKSKMLLNQLINSFSISVTSVYEDWIKVLQSLLPAARKMMPVEEANQLIHMGHISRALEILEGLVTSPDGMTREVFLMMQICYVKSGLGDKYKELHTRFGKLLDFNYPDINKPNTYFKSVDNSIFMIQGFSHSHGSYSGSGFCFAPELIATNRHVVEGSNPSDIKVIGKHGTYKVENVVLDPDNDIAVLKVRSGVPPLRLGEFDFVEPGEQVIAIGFPLPESDDYQENIYISKGIINAIKKTGGSTGRVIFIDAKIGRGMSGGPLINELGEVIGVLTLIRYNFDAENEKIFEEQPIALPIHLVKRLTP